MQTRRASARPRTSTTGDEAWLVSMEVEYLFMEALVLGSGFGLAVALAVFEGEGAAFGAQGLA